VSDVRFLVLSDLHAYSKGLLKEGETPPSFLHMGLPDDQPGEHPFADLERLIRHDSLHADAIICCGDIGDKAQPDAIAWAWNWIKRIALALEARKIFVTSGNHDLDSRYLYNDYDAKGTLLGLEDYPFADSRLNNEYWARSVVVLTESNFNIAILNSAAYHGYKEEWQHGRITKRTVNYLKERLQDLPKDRANLLICHHHLYKFGRVDLRDYSEMIDAAVLLDALGSGTYGRWLVLHGHRHWPNLEYASGSATSPIIFAAGSFSAVLYAELQDKARNQCYLLTLPGPADSGSYSLNGTFLAWDWISDVGWLPAKDRSGLPHKGGFGNRRGGDTVAEDIASLIDDSTPALSWSVVCNSVADLPYLTPQDLALCIDRLRSLGLEVLDRDGAPAHVGRSAV
jgi:3',5'-cyclic AMP phosphodiesterase CpdA